MTYFETIVNVAWVAMFGAGVALGGVFALAYNHVKFGRLEFRLGKRTYEGLAYLIMGPAAIVAAAGLSILRANNGEWVPGDWRGSEAFVDLCWFLVLVVAPLSALWGAGILARSEWHKRHDRNKGEDPAGITADTVGAVQPLSSDAAGKAHKKTKRRA